MKDILFWPLLIFCIASVPADIFYIKRFLKKRRLVEENEEVDSGEDNLRYVQRNSRRLRELLDLNMRLKPAYIDEKIIYRYEFVDKWKYNTFNFQEEFIDISLKNGDVFASMNGNMMHNKKIAPEYNRSIEMIKQQRTNMDKSELYEIENKLLKENTIKFVTRSYIYIYKVLKDKEGNELESEHKVYDLDLALNYFSKAN